MDHSAYKEVTQGRLLLFDKPLFDKSFLKKTFLEYFLQL